MAHNHIIAGLQTRLKIRWRSLRLFFDTHRRQVLSVIASLLIQTAFLLLLAFLFFPLLTPGGEISIEGHFIESEEDSDSSLTNVSESAALATIESSVMELSSDLPSQISEVQPQSRPLQLEVPTTKHVVRLPGISLSEFSDKELMSEVPFSVTSLPIHQHRGLTRVEEAGSTTSVANTLKGELKSISEDGDAVIVWLLDQSLSMQLDIKNLARDLNQTLVEIEKDQTSAVSHYVVAFGSDVKLFQDVTDKGQVVANAIYNLPPDPSGVENTFQSVAWCVDNLFRLPRWRGRRDRPERQKLLVLWTDESGDDYLYLEQTIQKCLAANVRVDIIGPSAVLGAQTGFTAYTHPENNLVYQLPVHRGPDSAYPQKVSLGYWYRGVPSNYDELERGPWPGLNAGMGGSNFDSLLSGLSPYALTRLARQTGGRYTIFDRPADRAPFKLSDLKDYMPEYDSFDEMNFKLLRQPLRQIVLASAAETWKSSLTRYSQPALGFSPLYPGQNPSEYRTSILQRRLPQAASRAYATLLDVERAIAIYDQAASLPSFQPKLEYDAKDDEYSDGLEFQNSQLVREDAAEEEDEKKSKRRSRRAKMPERDAIQKLETKVDISLLEQVYVEEESKRWKAWCDLNLGRLLAVSVRLQEYLIITEQIYSSPDQLKPTTNSVYFRPSAELRGGPFTIRRAELARKLLQRCIDNNPKTPWSVMAEAELKNPFGIEVIESFIPVPQYVVPVIPRPFVPEKPVILPKL